MNLFNRLLVQINHFSTKKSFSTEGVRVGICIVRHFLFSITSFIFTIQLGLKNVSNVDKVTDGLVTLVVVSRSVM